MPLPSMAAPSTSAPSSHTIPLFPSFIFFSPSSPPHCPSPSSFPLLLQSHLSPPLSLPPPITSFSSSSSFSSSNPIHVAFNIALSIHTKLRDPALLLHDSLLHLHPFLVGILSFPLLPFLLTIFSSSLFFPSSFPLLLQSNPSPPLLPPPSPISSKAFDINFPLHANFHNPTLLLNDGSLYLYPFLSDNPSFLLFPFILISFSSSLSSSKPIHEPFPFMMAPYPPPPLPCGRPFVPSPLFFPSPPHPPPSIQPIKPSTPTSSSMLTSLTLPSLSTAVLSISIPFLRATPLI